MNMSPEAIELQLLRRLARSINSSTVKWTSYSLPFDGKSCELLHKWMDNFGHKKVINRRNKEEKK